MTKRTKLLSLVVAAVLCFVAGFAIMFSTTKASADVTVPTAPYSEKTVTLDWSTTGAGLAIVLDAGVTTDWVVYDFYIPAGVTNDTTDAAVVVAKEYLHNGANTGDVSGSSAAATIDVSTLFDNEGTTDKHVVIAFDLAVGKVFTSAADAAFVEAASFENWAYVSNAEAKFTYLNVGTPSTKIIKDFKLYSEDGFIADWRSGNPGNTNNPSWFAVENTVLNLPATAVKPYGTGKNFTLSSNYRFRNKLGTNADWIIFEYTLTADSYVERGSNTLPAQNGLFSFLSAGNAYEGGAYSTGANDIEGELSGYLYAYAGGMVNTYAGGLFDAVDSAETPVKFMINTKTGLVAFEKAGVLTTYTIHSGATAFNAEDLKYFGFMSNGANAVAGLKDFVCYDSNGADLGLIVGGSLGLEAPAVNDATIRTDGVSVVSTSNSTARVVTAVPVTSNWIFFEWTNGANEYVAEGSKPGGAGFWIVASPYLAEIANPPANTKTGSMYYAAMQTDAESGYSGLLKGGRTTRIGISLADACMPAVWYNDVKGSLSAPLNLNFSYENPINNGTYYVAIWMNAIYDTDDGFSATGLRCFDENGNNIDISLSLMDYTAKTVTFMNGSEKHAEYKTAMPGNSLAQFTDLATPTGSGNFVGWTMTNDGLDFVNISDAVPANGVTLYAKFIADEKNVADYAGVYKCEETKKYFEITSDGKLISHVPGLTSGDVKVFEEEGTTVYSLGANVSKSTVANQITIGNDVYVKTNDYKTVTYKVEGKDYAVIKVPTGYLTVSNLVPKKTGHTFIGWYIEEAKFNFGSAINQDVTITAKLSVNNSPEASYALYEFNYYNKAQDTLYMINKDKTYTKIAAGVKTTGTYGLLVDGSNEYLVFDGDLDNAFRVDNVSADIAGNHYIKLFDEYTVTFVFGGTIENVVAKSNAESGYLIQMPENPTREGYEFKGWAYGDGTAFDGTKIQANTCEVYAIWEPVEGGVEVGGGIGALTIIAIVVAAVVVIGGVTVFVLWKKGILFAGK